MRFSVRAKRPTRIHNAIAKLEARNTIADCFDNAGRFLPQSARQPILYNPDRWYVSMKFTPIA